MGTEPETPPLVSSPSWCFLVVAASSVLGLALIADQAVRMFTTYDEVTYLRIAAHWWRTGEQDQITRLGSPLTFWKLQQAPTFWAIDRLGFGAWLDDPVAHQEELLPFARIGASWAWLLAMLIAANWARQVHGPKGMAMASAAFALSPNLLAHGALLTMEIPLLACSSAMLHRFWVFLKKGRSRDFYATAALGGLGMSLKFTTILIPPILAMLWAIDLGLRPVEIAEGRRPGWFRRLAGIIRKVGLGMIPFAAVLVVSNLLVTGFATIRPSDRSGVHPSLEGRIGPSLRPIASKLLETRLPNDWVAFARQMSFQRDGGPSYLMGERRMTGWTYYYPVTLAVKVPLAFWLLAIGRALMGRRPRRGDREWILPAFVAAFLILAMLGSKRNYGYRYLLPMASPAIVWASAWRKGAGGRSGCAVLGLAGMGFAVGSIHPHELAYFNELAGGPIGGRKILSDSNLDWGQGAKSLARLQRARPEFRDLTLFYFGDTDPKYYGVEGRRIVFDAVREPAGLPRKLTVETRFLAVSASLQWGPWGPAGYFRRAGSGHARGLHGRLDHRHLSGLGPRSAGQKRSRPRVRRSSRLSAVRAIRRTRPAESIGMASWTGMFWMTTKYSSPRRILMAKCPSTIRAFIWSKIRGSRSLAVPQIETRETIERPSGSTPA